MHNILGSLDTGVNAFDKLKKVQAKGINFNKKGGRRKRDTSTSKYSDDVDEDAKITVLGDFNSTAAQASWPTTSGITEDMATTWCTQNITQSPFYTKTCASKLDQASINETVDSCVNDIKVDSKLCSKTTL